MNTTDRKKLVESSRTFAQKGSFFLYLAMIYIVVVVAIGVIKEYLCKFIHRFTGIAALIAAFVLLGSFVPVEELGPYDEYGDTEVAAVEDDNKDNAIVTVNMENETEQSWSTILVNKQHKIPDDYEFELGTIDGSRKCDSRIIGPLKHMFEDAASEGIVLQVCSPYRNDKRQKYLFSRKVKGYVRAGSSYLDAFKLASTEVTVPGTSEHEIGLALDITGESYSSLDEGFAKSPEGMWLAKNSYKYGFILRYPENKESITGISYEPWHFRYVGLKAAEVINEKNITLEEYVEGK